MERGTAEFGGIRAVLWMLLAIHGAGCAAAKIVAKHSPMHPTNSQAVTFEGDATGSVKSVTLSYQRYSLSLNGSGDIVQTPDGSEVQVKTCNAASGATSLNCTHTMASAFADNSLITFSAKVIDTDNKSSTESYSFAAGNYPLPNDPIPVRLKGGTTEKLDVVFIPDTDITVANFRNNLDEVVEDLYFKYDAMKTWRGLYNFYYSGVQGNYEELCSFTNPSNMAQLTAVGDAVVFLHQNSLRDCRSGSRISSEINYDKSIIHESGHVLFNLQDEYCCDSSYSPQSCYPNLWSTQAACEAAASDIGYPTSNCVQLSSAGTTLNFWRIDPSTSPKGCMMGPYQHTSDSDFAQACMRRINHRYGKCMAGDCFSTPECP
jgi:hypothetical protein